MAKNAEVIDAPESTDKVDEKQRNTNYHSFRLNVRVHKDAESKSAFDVEKFLTAYADAGGFKLRTRTGRKSGEISSYTIDTPESYDKAMNSAANAAPTVDKAENAAAKLLKMAESLGLTVEELIAKAKAS